MNERIRELLEQSTNPPWDGEQGPMNEFNLERFAELLDKDAEKKYFSAGYIAGQSDGISETVRECAEFIAPMGDYCGGHGEPSAPSSRECARRLKQHFGVEE